MKTTNIFLFGLIFLLFNCCTSKQSEDSSLHVAVEQKLQRLTQNRVEAEIGDDLNAFLKHYDDQTISMPEYQLTLRGIKEIEVFYREIFKRQKVKTFKQRAKEFIHLEKFVVEIGTFEKEFFESDKDSLVTLKGKYWTIWKTQSDGGFKLHGEAFGYFHPVEHPETLIIAVDEKQPDDSIVYLNKEIPFELRAYNALMEKGVRTRDGILRASFFSNDGSIFPFADTTVTGVDKIKPYLIAYSNRGVVTIDSIMCYTYDFEYSDNYILEYDMFKVKWNVPNRSGRTEGKGIRIWKRQDDQSLRLYREIGTHNHIKTSQR